MAIVKNKKTRKDLSVQEVEQFGSPLIGRSFRQFNSDLNEIWEDYASVNFYLSEAREQIKVGAGKLVTVPSIHSAIKSEPLMPSVIYGIISRVTNKTNGKHAYIDSIALFEQFISGLVFKVYMDFPGKVKGLSQDASLEHAARRAKLIDVILESSDRDEMVQKLVEEKVRGNILR